MLTLPQECWLDRIEIWNRGANNANRLDGVTLRAFDAQEVSVHSEVLTNPGLAAKLTLFFPPGVKGKKIRIGLEKGANNGGGTKMVSLGEVKLWGSTQFVAPYVDVATMGVASQSTNSGASVAARAADGDKKLYSLTDTTTASNWWRLDFASDVPTGYLQIANRHDANDTRLAGLTLKVLNAGGAVLYSSVLTNPGKGSVLELAMPDNTQARTIWIGLENGASNGFGDKAVQLAEVRVLRPLDNPAADTDGDGIADGYEFARGMKAGDARDGQRDDNLDGRSNLLEYLVSLQPAGSSPHGHGIPGALTWELWRNITGNRPVDLTSNAAFYGPPSLRSLVLSAEAPQNFADNYGARLRGTVTAQVTGNYRFYLYGDEGCELWVGTTASRFTKRKVAWVAGNTAVQQWTKYSSQTSAEIFLTVGVEYYIEVLHKEATGSDSVGIGWSNDQGLARQVIPASALKSVVADVLDPNDNNLPDAWATDSGLTALPNPAAGEFGDPDNDGLSNLAEYQLGTNPLVPNGVAGFLSREVWMSLGGTDITALTRAAKFLLPPDQEGLTPGCEAPVNFGDNFGERLRGTVLAPVTGYYVFWIAGDDNVELWLSQDERKFGKQMIAFLRGTGSGGYSALRAWDRFSTQRSAMIRLEAGKRYFIEVLHKEAGAADHASIAWQPPGGVRSLIPAASLTSFMGDPDDLDDDYLPFIWEAAYGLDPNDNGRINPRNGEFADPDNDGLTNRQEYQLRTNPVVADTDGDGYSDGDEVLIYHTDPLLWDLAIASTASANIAGLSSSAASGDVFSIGNTSLLSTDRRGWIEYTFTTPVAGISLFEVTGRARGDILALEQLPLDVSIDGLGLGRFLLNSANGGPGIIKGLTPYLMPGAHTIRIFNSNTYGRRSLQVDSVKIYPATGPDVDANGIADWEALRLGADNMFLQLHGTSRTSPAFIEGLARFPSRVVLTAGGGTVTVRQGLPRQWYADVPLDATGATVALQASFDGAAFVRQHDITWQTTNALLEPQIVIRKGDSLRLTAYPGAAPTTGAVTLDMGNGEILPTTADVPLVRHFNQAGKWTIQATYQLDAQSEVLQGTLTVTVMGADFGPAFPVYACRPRVWVLPGLPAALENSRQPFVQADPGIYFWEQPPTATGTAASLRTFMVETPEAAAYQVLARTFDGGPVLAQGTIASLNVSSTSATEDTEVVYTYDDGDRLVRMGIVADNLPPGGYIRLTIFVAGVTFADGTRTKSLYAADFDANGLAYVLFNYPAGQPTSVCHRLYVYDAQNNLIGQR